MSGKSYNLGCMKQITDLRTIWPHEALDFTPWLANNLGLLSDAIGGIELKLIEKESQVGNFRVDILAKTCEEPNNSMHVVIENQLTRSDHVHLGEVLTYASGKDAQIVIWLVKNARQEHREAVEWLNRETPTGLSFFMIEVELWQIDDSRPAVLFKVAAKPDDWPNRFQKRANLSDTQRKQRQFWTDFTLFLETREEGKLLSIPDAPARHYLTFRVGISDFAIACTVDTQKDLIGVEFGVRNIDFFHWLKANKESLAQEFGSTPKFSPVEKETLNRVFIQQKGTIDPKDPKRKDYFDWFAQMLIRLRNVGLKEYQRFLESRRQ